MRRWTLVTIVVIALALVGATLWQLALLAGNEPPPGRPTTPTIPGP